MYERYICMLILRIGSAAFFQEEERDVTPAIAFVLNSFVDLLQPTNEIRLELNLVTASIQNSKRFRCSSQPANNEQEEIKSRHNTDQLELNTIILNQFILCISTMRQRVHPRFINMRFRIILTIFTCKGKRPFNHSVEIFTGTRCYLQELPLRITGIISFRTFHVRECLLAGFYMTVSEPNCQLFVLLCQPLL